jgi:trehalose synthase
MSFGVFKNQLSSVSLERYLTLCESTTLEVIQLAQLLKKNNPNIRILNFTSAFRSVGASEMSPYEGGLYEQLGIPFEWWVVGTSHAYNRLQLRIIKAIHGDDENFTPFDEEDKKLYNSLPVHISQNLTALVKPSDVIVCHDPYLLPLIPILSKICPRVLWRCHGGSDSHNETTEVTWDFLKPFMMNSRTSYCFSRAAYAPKFLTKSQISVIHPFIQPESPKNCFLNKDHCLQIYNTILGRRDHFRFIHNNFTVEITAPAQIWGQAPDDPYNANIMCQIGWWDRMKDHLGVLKMFKKYFEIFPKHTYLFLIGPMVKPENNSNTNLDTWHDVMENWRKLPKKIQKRVVIISLPYDNRTRNALMVNALQRISRIILQKSLQEGFGLTVTEAMWKEKPVVGSSVGGIQDQIIHQQTGYLLSDPNDLNQCAEALNLLLRQPNHCIELGKNAHRRVLQNFLLPHAQQKYLQYLQDNHLSFSKGLTYDKALHQNAL